MMCGGRGTRLDAAGEKPLYPIAGRPLVDWVLDALTASQIDAVHGVTSPHAPETAAHLAARDVARIETPGEGYVADLQAALDRVGTPVVSVAADLPLLTGDAIDRVLDQYDGTDSIQVCVPAALKRQLGLHVDTGDDSGGRAFVPAGINVVAGAATERVFLTDDPRFAVNVNRRSDARVAAALR